MSKAARRVMALVFATAGLAGLLPATAAGHGESSSAIRSVVDRVEPATPGVELEVLRGKAAALSATNRSSSDLEVIGDAREPFLRIGPRGTFANVNSRTWYRSGNPDGIGLPPDGVRIGAPPRWERVSRDPAWTWFDHRLHPGKVQVPREAAEGRRTVRLDEWTIPMRLGSQPLQVKGHVEFRPLLGAVVPELTSPAALGGGGAVATILRGRVPGIYLQGTGEERVAVTGREGEPFLRLDPSGVQVNLRSPTHVDDVLARGEVPRVQADAAAPPRWQKVADSPGYGWLDTRAVYTRGQPPAEILRRDEPAVLGTWSIPVTVGARRADIEGRNRWLPTPNLPKATAEREAGGSTPEWAAGIILALGLAGLVVALRLRRRPVARRVA